MLKALCCRREARFSSEVMGKDIFLIKWKFEDQGENQRHVGQKGARISVNSFWL